MFFKLLLATPTGRPRLVQSRINITLSPAKNANSNFFWVSTGLSAFSISCLSSWSISMFKFQPESDKLNINGSQLSDNEHIINQPKTSSSNTASPEDSISYSGNETVNDTKQEESTGFLTKNFISLPWNGLSFLRNSIPLHDIHNVLSSWTWPISLNAIQDKVSSLLLELGRGPGSLYSEIVDVPPDPAIYPECEWDAEVRLGDSLCIGERVFLKQRRQKMKRAFAYLFEVSEDEIDARDLPIVALAGSGGGYRATINTIGSLIGAHQSGIWDCTTYVAGISGSCWAIGALYTGVAGSLIPRVVADHLKERMKISYFDTNTLDLLVTSPTNKYLLWGLLRKANAPSGTVSLIDVYGTLVSSRLFVPSDLNLLDPRFLSLYHMRRHVDDASLPLPIFTAIHHEIPSRLAQSAEQLKELQNLSVDNRSYDSLVTEEQELQRQAGWLWFEFTPYEIGCDDLGAWIPSWALGRRFEHGKNLERIPELSFTIQSGMFASAFCATLKDYFKEVQPMLRTLPTQLYDWLQEVISSNDQELHTIHPVVPDEVPNFVKGMNGRLRESSPPGIENKDTLGLMDAGAELNIPYYPLLRRDVDCIIALDASTDYQDLWFTRAEEYAVKRGLSKWPRGARWPTTINTEKTSISTQAATVEDNPISDAAAEDANRTLAEVQEKELSGQATRQLETQTQGSSKGVGSNGLEDLSSKGPTSLESNSRLSSCTIWIGSSKESDSSAKLDEFEEQDLLDRDGIAIVYIPLISNPVVSDFDPLQISTWRSQMDEDVTERLLKVSQANFEDGRTKIIRLLKAIWLRKRAERQRTDSVDTKDSSI